MHRPPKPTFKSAQIFNHPIRKLINPQNFMVQGAVQTEAELNLMKSMRQSSTSNYINKTIINAPNAQYIQISTKQGDHKCSSAIKSFKIRNYTHQNRRVKENTIPFKGNSKQDNKNKKGVALKKASSLNEDTIYNSLSSYPPYCQLYHLNNKIGFTKNTQTTLKHGKFDEWAIIMCCSVLSLLLSQESLFQNFKEKLNKFCQLHEGITIIIKTRGQSDCLALEKELQKKKFSKYNYIIYTKSKYSEKINPYDIQEIKEKNMTQISKIIVLNDIHDPVFDLPFLSRRNEEDMKILDLQAKFIFLGCARHHSVISFFEGTRILLQDDQLLVSDRNLVNQTDRLMMMEEINHKIGVVKSTKNIKYMRCNSRKQPNHTEEIPSKKSILRQERMQQFRRKMIKYAKILEEENEDKRKSGKSIQKNGKTSIQMVDQIVKINAHIFQQIHKYREKCAGINHQSISLQE